MNSSISPSAHPFYGPRVVAAAFVVAIFGWGIGFYGPPVYLEAVRQARGWPIALVSGAVTLHFLAGVAIIANLPALHRRFGLPFVTTTGAIVLALGVLSWSLATAPWQLYVATLLTGAGWPALGAAAVNAIIAPWFVARRPIALSMAYNGASIGGVVFSPLWVALIERVGFPLAASLLGSVMIAVIGSLSALVLTRTPAQMGQVPDGGVAPASSAMRVHDAKPVTSKIRDRAFLTLALGMALALFAQIGLIAQLVSFLTPVHGTTWAGFAAGLTTAAAILGRTIIGWLLRPTTDRRLAAALSLVLQVAGCAAFVTSGENDTALLFLGLVLFGFGIGNATSLPPLIAQIEFSSADTPRVVAAIVATSQAAYAFAPATFGLIRQWGSDHAMFIIAALIQFGAILVYAAGRQAYRERS